MIYITLMFLATMVLTQFVLDIASCVGSYGLCGAIEHYFKHSFERKLYETGILVLLLSVETIAIMGHVNLI